MTLSNNPTQKTGHVLRIIRQRLGPHVLKEQQETRHEDRARVDRTHLLTLLGFLRRDRDTALDMLVDLSAIDHGETEGRPRFEVFYRLRSAGLPYRLWLSVYVPEDDPHFPSIMSLHPSAGWFERELYDLFGLYAEGHPDIRRLILFPGFMGHPMRGNYPHEKGQSLVPLRQTQDAVVVGAPAETPPNPDEKGKGL